MSEDLLNEHAGVLVSDADSGDSSGGSSEDRSLASLIESLPAAKQQDLLEFAYKAGVVLSCLLAVMLFHYEHDAQKYHYAFEIRDWMVGIIGLPFGGAIWTYLKRVLSNKHNGASRHTHK